MDPLNPQAHDPHAAHFTAEFRLRRRRQRIAGAIAIASAILLVATIFGMIWQILPFTPTSFAALVPIAFLIALTHCIFSMINFRCPRCNKGLARLRNPRFCFNCGLRLRE